MSRRKKLPNSPIILRLVDFWGVVPGLCIENYGYSASEQ